MAGIGWCECEEGQTRWRDRQGRIQPMIQQVTQRGDCRKGQAQVFQGCRLADASRASVAGLEPATMITLALGTQAAKAGRSRPARRHCANRGVTTGALVHARS